MKRKKFIKLNRNIIDCLLIILLFIATILVGITIGIYLEEYKGLLNKFTDTEIKDFSECENLSLTDTAYCLRDYMLPYFNYTVRDDNPKTLEDIKQKGGDCYDYTLIYDDMAKSLEFYTEIVKIYTPEEGHTFLIMWNNNLTQYCKLDQLCVDCLRIENEKL